MLGLLADVSQNTAVNVQNVAAYEVEASEAGNTAGPSGENAFLMSM